MRNSPARRCGNHHRYDGYDQSSGQFESQRRWLDEPGRLHVPVGSGIFRPNLVAALRVCSPRLGSTG